MLQNSGISSGGAIATTSASDVDHAIGRAKRMSASNLALQSELRSMRSEENVKRDRLLSVQQPLVQRWCLEADVFLAQLHHVLNDDTVDPVSNAALCRALEDGSSAASMISTRKLLKPREMLIKELLEEPLKALNSFHSHSLRSE